MPRGPDCGLTASGSQGWKLGYARPRVRSCSAGLLPARPGAPLSARAQSEPSQAAPGRNHSRQRAVLCCL